MAMSDANDAIATLRTLESILSQASPSARLNSRVRAELQRRVRDSDRRGPRHGVVLALAFATGTLAAVVIGVHDDAPSTPLLEGPSIAPVRDRAPDQAIDSPDAGPAPRLPILPRRPSPRVDAPESPHHEPNVAPDAQRSTVSINPIDAESPSWSFAPSPSASPRAQERAPRAISALQQPVASGEARRDDAKRDDVRRLASAPAPGRLHEETRPPPPPNGADRVGVQPPPQQCASFVVGDGTCRDDALWKEFDTLCYDASLVPTAVTPDGDCDHGSRHATLSCCPPTPEKPLSNCSAHTVEEGGLCIPPGLEKELFACPSGQLPSHIEPAFDCADSGSTKVAYQCCDAPQDTGATCQTEDVLDAARVGDCVPQKEVESAAAATCAKKGLVVKEVGGGTCDGGQVGAKVTCCPSF
jgi:hypothetical protein